MRMYHSQLRSMAINTPQAQARSQQWLETKDEFLKANSHLIKMGMISIFSKLIAIIAGGAEIVYNGAISHESDIIYTPMDSTKDDTLKTTIAGDEFTWWLTGVEWAGNDKSIIKASLVLHRWEHGIPEEQYTIVATYAYEKGAVSLSDVLTD